MKPENRKKPHRATSEIPIILDEKFYSDLVQTILKVQWPYKSEHDVGSAGPGHRPVPPVSSTPQQWCNSDATVPHFSRVHLAVNNAPVPPVPQ